MATKGGKRFEISDLESRLNVHVLCSKNKDTDQLVTGYSTADLRLCFCIYAKSRIFHDTAQMICISSVLNILC